MGLLGRKEILELQGTDLQRETVDVPEWGGSVIVRELTGTERDAWEMSLTVLDGENKDSRLQNLRARLVALSVVDEAGTRIFSAEDAGMLGCRNARVLDRLYQTSKRLSRLTRADVAAAEKNSAPGPSDGSTSA